MKLSEAIRLGAMLRPHGHGAILRRNATCALGAALEAVGLLTDWEQASRNNPFGNWDAWWKNVPFSAVLWAKATHPLHGAEQPISNIIVSLNDSHGWTREAIADWVATVEPQEEAKQPPFRDPDIKKPTPKPQPAQADAALPCAAADVSHAERVGA